MDDISSRPDKPWLALYPPGVTATLEPEFATALGIFRACVRERPAHTAFWYFGREFSFAEIDAAGDALAAWLQENGIARGDRVAIILQNLPEFMMMMVGAWKAGAVPLPANPMYRAAELGKVFADGEPRAILCECEHLKEVAGAFAQIGQPGVPLLVTMRDALRPDPAPKPVDLRGAMWFLDVLKTHEGRKPSGPPPLPDDLGLLMYTSGTTGVPKGAAVTHRSLAFNAELTRQFAGMGPQSRLLALAPFFHITGFVCHLLTAFSARATTIAFYRFDPALVLDVIRRARPTFTVGAITAFNAMMNTPGVSAEDFACFERVYSGGAPIPPALAQSFEARLGHRLYPAYGMTEVAGPTHFAPFGRLVPIDPASGTLPIGIPGPSTDAIIVDENDNELPIGEVGEVLTRGPQLMVGYWRKPEENAAVLRNGWMHTGDVGFRDATGWFYLVDRKKDMIICSGFKVWPREVEDVLYMHPAVREAAVIGVPDDYRGETVKAYISLKAGAEFVEADVLCHCRERLAGYKVPKMVEVLPELPKSLAGKIQRVALRKPPA